MMRKILDMALMLLALIVLAGCMLEERKLAKHRRMRAAAH